MKIVGHTRAYFFVILMSILGISCICVKMIEFLKINMIDILLFMLMQITIS